MVSSDSAAFLALVRSVALMLPDRSRISATSKGLGAAPHAPRQDAPVTLPVVPCETPMTGAKKYFTVSLAETMIVLHLSPAAGEQG